MVEGTVPPLDTLPAGHNCPLPATASKGTPLPVVSGPHAQLANLSSSPDCLGWKVVVVDSPPVSSFPRDPKCLAPAEYPLSLAYLSI